MTPPAPITGSAMKAATVSGSSRKICASRLSARRGHGDAVIALHARDDLLLAVPPARVVVVPRHLDGGVVRLGPGVAEEHLRHLHRHQGDQALGQLRGGIVRFVIEDVVVGQAPQLPSRRVDQPLLAEAQRGAPQAREALDIFLAVLVIDVDALALGDDERPLALVPLEMRVRVKIVGDVAAGGRIASLHGYCPRAWAMRYYPLPRAQVKPARPNRTARLGVADFPRRAATTGRRAKCKALIRLGERRVPTIGQRDINRLLPSRARERRYFVGAAKGNSLCVMPSTKGLVRARRC